MNSIEEYSKNKPAREIAEILSGNRNKELPELSIFGKALVFKYSVDGYDTLNENLRKSKGKNLSEFGKLLNKALDKLPNFEGMFFFIIKSNAI